MNLNSASATAAQPIMPNAAQAQIISAQTAANGTDFVPFPAGRCNSLDLVNNTGAAIEYQRGGTGGTIAVPAGASRMIVGITDASQIGVRRVDQTTAQVTVTAEAFSL